jgi:methylaspartate mutase sigma subunit
LSENTGNSPESTPQTTDGEWEIMSTRSAYTGGGRPGREVLVAGTTSDSHTWNLIFLQLFAEERGHRVRNLGPCVPAGLLLAECLTEPPAVVVLSSVNGHGETDGLRMVAALRSRQELAAVPVVIGGKLGIRGGTDPHRVQRLLAAGFDGVYDDGDAADVADVAGFAAFLAAPSRLVMAR